MSSLSDSRDDLVTYSAHLQDRDKVEAMLISKLKLFMLSMMNKTYIAYDDSGTANLAWFDTIEAELAVLSCIALPCP